MKYKKEFFMEGSKDLSMLYGIILSNGLITTRNLMFTFTTQAEKIQNTLQPLFMIDPEKPYAAYHNITSLPIINKTRELFGNINTTKDIKKLPDFVIDQFPTQFLVGYLINSGFKETQLIEKKKSHERAILNGVYELLQYEFPEYDIEIETTMGATKVYMDYVAAQELMTELL